MSIRTWVLLGGLLCALLPAAVLGVGSVVAMRTAEIDNELERSELASRNLADQFGEFLGGVQAMLLTLADQVRRAPDVAAARTVLADARRHYPLLDRLTLVGADGKIIAAEPQQDAEGRSIVGLDLNDRGYFRDVVRTRQPVVDRSVLIGRAANRPVVVVAAPVLDAGGALQGVLAAAILANNLQDTVERQRRGQSGQTIILASDGALIAHPDAEMIRQRPSYAPLPVWRDMQSAANGPLRAFVDHRGGDRIGGFATVANSGWKVIVSETRAEIERQIFDAYSGVLIWVAAAVVLALLGTFLLARWLARPIETLRVMAGGIAGGDFSKRVAEDGPLEIAALGRAVNAMACAIERSLDGERTAKERLEAAVRAYGEFSGRVAAGDLTVRAKVADGEELAQLGAGLNHMTESLGRLVGEIRNAASSVESAAAEILAATSQQVAATTEEATAVRQTAATVAEVRQTTDAASDKIRAVAEAAQRMEAISETGRRSVDESVRGSEEAKARMEALAERILAFSDQAQEIAEINATVGDLAEQSNLLAVNASIEAAKAGEAGRGFAVVAAEVKALADRCKEATTQVRRIVTEIQKSAQSAVIAAEQGVKMAETGAGIARRSGEAITTLAENVAQAAQAAQQIMAAADQQEAGMEQVVEAMRNIEQSSAQTVAATRQVERAAKDLNDLSKTLGAIVSTTRVAAE